MSKKVGARRRHDTPIEGLARLLDTPHLARVVPHLPSEALHQIVRYRGVEGSAELLAAATPAQLASVVDLDLWQGRQPGGDEEFDATRFGEWLEGLAESGDSGAATIVARLDGRLVAAGLAAHVRVFDAAAASPWWTGDDEAPGEECDGATLRGLRCEVGGYVVQARTEESWDALVTVLAALEADHAEYFHTVMRACRRLSNSRPESDGLDHLLRGSRQLLHDLGLDREQRRASRGYLGPAEARAFLEMARQPRQPRGPAWPPNPIAASYLSSPGDEPESTEAAASSACPEEAPAPRAARDSDATDRRTADEVAVLLAEVSLAGERPRALLTGSSGLDSRPVVHELMERLREVDGHCFLSRTRELAFLANALVAGCSLHARKFSAQEASDAALATCSLGVRLWPGSWPTDNEEARGRTPSPRAQLPETFLVDHDLVTAFEVGWSALHETSLSVASELLEVLRGVNTMDTATQQGLVALRRELLRHSEARAPWRARDALDVLAVLDTPAWTALLGALDECPVVPEILTAILEGRRGSVSATAFEFVSSLEQLSALRAFGRKLGDVLR